MTFRAVGTVSQGNGASNIVPGLPAGWAVGDLLLCFVCLDNDATGGVTGGMGAWTLVVDSFQTSPDGQEFVIYKQIATSGTVAPTMTQIGCDFQGYIGAWSGRSGTVNLSTPQVQTTAQTAPQTITPGAYTASAGDDVAIYCGLDTYGNSSFTNTVATGYTGQVNFTADTAVQGVSCLQTLDNVSAGSQAPSFSWSVGGVQAGWSAWVVDLPASGGSGGTSTAAESSAGTEASNRTIALTAPAAETSAGTTAQNATAALTGASTETSAGTTAQNATVVVTAGVTESSAGTDSSDRSITLTTGVAETSAGTTAQDAPSAASGTFGTLETSAGTDATDRTVALGGGTGESSAGTTAQSATTTLTVAVSETSASSTAQNATVSLTGAVNETSAGTDAADQSGIQTSAVTETSAGTTAQNYSIGTISRGVTETSAGTTSQDGTVPPPVGSGSNGLRRWLIQQYTDYFDKRDKDKALALIAKDIQTVSAGVVTPKMIRERAPQPVVNQTAALAAAERQRQNEVWQKHLQEQQNALLNAQMALANMPDMNAMDLQHRIEQGEEEDLLLLTSVL